MERKKNRTANRSVSASANSGRRIIDALKRKESQIAAESGFSRAVIDALLVLDERLRVRFANRTFYELFQTAPKDTENQLLYSLGSGQWSIPRLQTLIDEIVASGELRRDFRLDSQFPKIGRKVLLINARRINTSESDSQTSLIVLSIEDITQRESAEREVLEISAYEQRRIGHDLHDSVGQALSGLSYLARDLTGSLKDKGAPEAETAALIMNELERALDQIRRLSKGLVPVEIDSEGLMSALESLAARIAEMSRVECTFECPAPVLVDDSQTVLQLCLIAQEATTNALKHARPKHVRISLTCTRNHLQLAVSDDGLGIGELRSANGMGLKIMNYRAGLLGAKLIVERAKEGGTRVTCRLPWIARTASSSSFPGSGPR